MTYSSYSAAQINRSCTGSPTRADRDRGPPQLLQTPRQPRQPGRVIRPAVLRRMEIGFTTYRKRRSSRFKIRTVKAPALLFDAETTNSTRQRRRTKRSAGRLNSGALTIAIARSLYDSILPGIDSSKAMQSGNRTLDDPTRFTQTATVRCTQPGK